MLLKDLRSEGFYVQMMNIDEGLSQARKGDISLSITETESLVKIETAVEDAAFVKNSVYEVVIRLSDSLGCLKEQCDPLKFSIMEPVEKSRSYKDVLALLSPQVLSTNLKGNTKEEIIRDLVMLLANSGRVRDWQMVLSDILFRENSMSTGMQHGIALPHAKSDGVVGTCIAIGLKPEGIDFGEEKAQLVIGIAGMGGEHMEVLAKVCTALDDAAVLEKMKTTDDKDWIMSQLF